MINADQAEAAAQLIVAATSSGPAEPLTRMPSRSHYVFATSALVVKVIDASDHARLDRELRLALELPPGLSAPVLASGAYQTAAGVVRYACLTRLPGSSPPSRLAGIDRTTACRWAEQAIERLQQLHSWVPSATATAILEQPLDHGGFVGRPALEATLDRVRVADGDAIVPVAVLDGLSRIAAEAPAQASVAVPVHADCFWDNWLVQDGQVTALLDFEWARFGEPADDWMFLSRFSGVHRHAVLELIATTTATPWEALATACEVREASHVLADLEPALRARSERSRQVADHLVAELHELAVERSWWRGGAVHRKPGR